MTDTLTIRQDTCTITLYLPKLTDLPLKNIRKLFAMVLSEPLTNENAIQTLGPCLEEMVATSKADRNEASRIYQREWRLIEKPTRRRTRKEIQETAKIKAHNAELTKQLKHTKAQHERWVKLQALWNDTKH